MKRKYRLARSTDFERVRRQGKAYTHPLVVMIALANELDQARIGVAAGRSVGGAVARNRAKRVLRAAIQVLLPRITASVDIILLARQPITKVKSSELELVVETLLKKAKAI